MLKNNVSNHIFEMFRNEMGLISIFLNFLETLLETLLFLIVLITNHLIYYLSCLHFNVDKPLIKTALSNIPTEITSVNKLELVS